ncbi:MAG TPA: pyridoxamine 5'-phosphate oxidase family protein [Mycobacteriales bacterium]|nr:pyridoxamine 5'-phosphate oxidase family protein [Mycobacteriales bacterium]
MREQRRSRRVAMTAAEVDAFLGEQRTCRVATTGADGRPHVTPLWFAWDGRALWLTSLVRSQRWTDLARDPRVAVVIDTGELYGELRGVEITGTATAVGDVPRGAGPHPELAGPERLFARKYAGVDEFTPDGKHAWLRVDPDKMVSWDFRKLR